MLKSEIQIGKDYALREKRASGTPFQRVRILEHIRGTKWKVEWVEPNLGLVHFVDSSWLICRWKDHKAFLKEEENAERLRKHNEQQGYRNDDSPVALALSVVFESTGDEATFYRGTLSGPPAAIDRVRARARVEEGKNSPAAYIDRRGELHLPFDEAVELARRFCAAEPAPPLAKAESVERKWAEEARHPDGDYLVGLLNEYRAAWALVRQWAGLDAAVAEREAQIRKLERLVWDAIYMLQKAHLDDEASKLRRALERR